MINNLEYEVDSVTCWWAGAENTPFLADCAPIFLFKYVCCEFFFIRNFLLQIPRKYIKKQTEHQLTKKIWKMQLLAFLMVQNLFAELLHFLILKEVLYNLESKLYWRNIQQNTSENLVSIRERKYTVKQIFTNK